MIKLKQEGVTIFELLLAIAIVAILATIVLPGFSKIRKIQILRSTTEDIVSVIEKARSQTMASLNSSSYGIHFEDDEVVIFTGTTFSSGNSSNENIDLISPINISDINLADSGEDIFFNRLSGIPSTSRTITVSAPGIPSNIITISSLGFVSLN